jgi:hypothetical protein
MNFPENQKDPFIQQINPFVIFPDSVIQDTMSHDGKTIFSVVYHTGEFGLRLTKKNPRATKHFILSGDSNLFGIGVKDDETLPAKLGEKIPSYDAYNMGFVGMGPSSTLHFFEHYNLKKMIGNQAHGIFLYDFHFHLIDRVIGSKSFMTWSKKPPRYIYEKGQLIYKGPFENYWPVKFYQFLNQLPYNQILIPNLPRITHEHIELTAKILAAIKKEYLAQTDAQNKFFVSFNPKFINVKNSSYVDELISTLRKEGIQVITFDKADILPLPQIPGEVHLNATAHENYSQMLLKKLQPYLINE